MLTSLFLSSPALAADLVGVVHPYNLVESIEDKALKKMYLGNTKTWEQGEPLTVYLRAPKSDANEALFDEVLQMPRQRYDSYWDRRQLSGQDMKPKQLTAIGEILAIFERDPGAVTVVSMDEASALPSKQVRLVRIGDRSLPSDAVIKPVDWSNDKPAPAVVPAPKEEVSQDDG